uniref:Uncharacterized protein n=1 Tax=Sphaerodactylus townsendi TaxID=933632 RepID=A0ACB8F568_9SAUR
MPALQLWQWERLPNSKSLPAKCSLQAVDGAPATLVMSVDGAKRAQPSTCAFPCAYEVIGREISEGPKGRWRKRCPARLSQPVGCAEESGEVSLQPECSPWLIAEALTGRRKWRRSQVVPLRALLAGRSKALPRYYRRKRQSNRILTDSRLRSLLDDCHIYSLGCC